MICDSLPVVPANLTSRDFWSAELEPAGVRGGEARAEIRGLPWGDWKPEELGVCRRVESGESSSREGTCDEGWMSAAACNAGKR